MESLFQTFYSLVLRQDSIFSFTLFVSAATFVAAELFWVTRHLRARRAAVPCESLPHDDTRFSVLWTLVPAVVLISLAFVQVGPAKTTAQKAKVTRHASLPSVP